MDEQSAAFQKAAQHGLQPALARVLSRQQVEAEITARMLALCFAKPLETFSAIPDDWAEGVVHCDYELDAVWPDVGRELLPMLNNLSGMLAHKCRVPIDVCIVRPPGGRVFSIAVRYQ